MSGNGGGARVEPVGKTNVLVGVFRILGDWRLDRLIGCVGEVG